MPRPRPPARQTETDGGQAGFLLVRPFRRDYRHRNQHEVASPEALGTVWIGLEGQRLSVRAYGSAAELAA
jgi:hypothetical protein